MLGKSYFTVKLDGKHKINVSVKKKRRVAKKAEEQPAIKVEKFLNTEEAKPIVDSKENQVADSVNAQSNMLNAEWILKILMLWQNLKIMVLKSHQCLQLSGCKK